MTTRQDVEKAYAAAQGSLLDYIVQAIDTAVSSKPDKPVDPPIDPPVGGGPINLMVRGQSNALLFVDWKGVWVLQAALEKATGRKVNIIASYGREDGNNTINSGSAFLRWDTDGKQAGLLRYLKALPAEQKQGPFITLWMHNEDEQKTDEVTTDWWVQEVRVDADLVRKTVGRSVAESPYLFVPIRYNYGKRFPEVQAGMELLVRDTGFNARISWAAWDAVMDGDGQPNSSHMGDADVKALGTKLAPVFAEMVKGQTPSDKPKVLKFKDFPAFNVQEATLHIENTTGLPAQWVLFDDNHPQYSWRGQPQDVPANNTITVRAVEDGDKVKVFTAGFAYADDSLPFKFATPGDPTYPTGTAALEKVNKFLEGLHGGENIERNAAWELSQEEHSSIHQQVPMDVGRVFLSWRPQGGFGPNQYGQLASQDTVRAFVGSIKKLQQAGYKRCFADCTDVLDSWEGLKVPGAESLIKQHVRMVCEEVKAQGISADFLCIGPVNEWAIEQNDVHRMQDDLIGLMRGILPQHILSSGSDYWKYWGKLIENQSYQPPKDELTIIDCHSYKRMDEAGWKWLAGELSKWQQRTKRRVIFGEAGCGENNVDHQNEAVWQEQLRLMLPIMRPFVPLTWAIGFGGHWRHNEYDPRSKVKPAVAQALRDGLGV